MKTRKILNGVIIWFGSKGINKEGNMIKAYDDSKYDKDAKSNRTSTININYDINKDAIVSSLNQKISVIKGELWNHVNYGLPLFDKIKNKSIIDATIIRQVLNTDNVLNIEKLQSIKDNINYKCSLKINTIFGEIEITNNYI